jgi:ABC-type transporter Mla subunit MlaD
MSDSSSKASKQTVPESSRSLDLDAKRQLLVELVDCLTERARKAERSLGSEQRTARAMNMTLEALSHQNQQLQQQLQYLAQSWPPGNVVAQSAEGQLLVDSGGHVVGTASSAPLPVEAVVRQQ